MNDRIKFTENEKIAQQVTTNGTMFNMAEHRIEKILENEKSAKFNEEFDKLAESYEKHNSKVIEGAESLGNIENLEIKPMFNRLLIEPFEKNPFQRMKVENGIIVDAGGFVPFQDLNPNTGKYEDMPEFIVTGAVQEVGPDVKYIKEGDVVFYRKDTAVPVPFFKFGYVSVAENQVIAVVNEELEKRFKNID